jgi:prepilin-type N-terminal cleavage/methylation domain-containing protein
MARGGPHVVRHLGTIFKRKDQSAGIGERERAAAAGRGTSIANVDTQVPSRTRRRAAGEIRWVPFGGDTGETEEGNMMLKRDEKGFTLIELLVVVAIIGILAAIAIPQFSAYRAQGFNARAASDLRNLATAEEAYFAANAAYTGTLPNLIGFKQSPGVSITVVPNGTVFTASANHASGNKTFDWNSANGGLQNAP